VSAQPSEFGETLLSVEEVAAWLGVSKYTVLRAVRAGRLHAVYVTPQVIRFRPVDVEAYIEANRR
jgi:excisionase family DNA binding protein